MLKKNNKKGCVDNIDFVNKKITINGIVYNIEKECLEEIEIYKDINFEETKNKEIKNIEPEIVKAKEKKIVYYQSLKNFFISMFLGYSLENIRYLMFLLGFIFTLCLFDDSSDPSSLDIMQVLIYIPGMFLLNENLPLWVMGLFGICTLWALLMAFSVSIGLIRFLMKKKKYILIKEKSYKKALLKNIKNFMDY